MCWFIFLSVSPNRPKLTVWKDLYGFEHFVWHKCVTAPWERMNGRHSGVRTCVTAVCVCAYVSRVRVCVCVCVCVCAWMSVCVCHVWVGVSMCHVCVCVYVDLVPDVYFRTYIFVSMCVFGAVCCVRLLWSIFLHTFSFGNWLRGFE